MVAVPPVTPWSSDARNARRVSPKGLRSGSPAASTAGIASGMAVSSHAPPPGPSTARRPERATSKDRRASVTDWGAGSRATEGSATGSDGPDTVSSTDSVPGAP